MITIRRDMNMEGHQRQHPSAPLRIVREGSAKYHHLYRSFFEGDVSYLSHLLTWFGRSGILFCPLARLPFRVLFSCLRASVFCVSVYLSFLVLSDSNGFGCSNISIPSATATATASTLTPFIPPPLKPDFASSSSCIPRHRMVARVSTSALYRTAFVIPFQASARP